MKFIKAITDFGIKEVKPISKAKEIFGENWIVAEVPVQYMNAKEPLMLRKILHFNTGANLPIKGMHFKATAKDFFVEAENFLKRIPADTIKKEVSNYPTINL